MLMREVGRILFVFLFLYLVELGVTYLLYPRSDTTNLDAARAGQTILRTSSRYVVYGRHRLTESGAKIIFVGASNVRDGFRPNEIASFSPNTKVHNLSVGGANILEISQIVSLLLKSVPKTETKELVIVVGVWYQTFMDDQRQWNGTATHISSAMLRFGLYRDSDNNLPVPRLSENKMPYAIEVLRPLFLAANVSSYLHGVSFRPRVDAFKDSIKAALFSVNTTAGQDHNPPNVVDKVNEDRDKTLSRWKEQMGPISDWSEKPFETLLESITAVTATGAKFVLADLPIPKWHSDRLPYDREYQKRLGPWLNRYSSIQGFSYATLREYNEAEFFSDSVHPLPEITPLWANRISHIIEENLH